MEKQKACIALMPPELFDFIGHQPNPKAWKQFLKVLQEIPNDHTKEILIAITAVQFNSSVFFNLQKDSFYELSIEQMKLLPLEKYKPEISLFLAYMTNKFHDPLIIETVKQLTEEQEKAFNQFFQPEYFQPPYLTSHVNLDNFIHWLGERQPVPHLLKTFPGKLHNQKNPPLPDEQAYPHISPKIQEMLAQNMPLIDIAKKLSQDADLINTMHFMRFLHYKNYNGLNDDHEIFYILTKNLINYLKMATTENFVANIHIFMRLLSFNNPELQKLILHRAFKALFESIKDPLNQENFFKDPKAATLKAFFDKAKNLDVKKLPISVWKASAEGLFINWVVLNQLKLSPEQDDAMYAFIEKEEPKMYELWNI